MNFLLDSDCVIDFLSGKGLGVGRLEKVANEKLFLSVISWTEVEYGIYRLPNASKRQKSFDGFLKNFGIKILPIDLDTSSKFIEIKVDLENKHAPLENFDLLIAATACINNLTLVTGNLKHFERVEGLKLNAN